MCGPSLRFCDEWLRKREKLCLMTAVRLLGRLPLRLFVLLHGFSLFLVCLVQHLLLLLNRLLVLALIFLFDAAGALSFSRY